MKPWLTPQYAQTLAFREVVRVCQPDRVRAFLLSEMGIGADAEASPDGLLIRTGHMNSVKTIMDKLRGDYDVIAVMSADRRYGVKVITRREPVQKTQQLTA